MLAEFRVGNYRSFKDEQVLSLIASSEESKGANSVEVGGFSLLKSAVIYGANASGKSNLIKAMACMRGIVFNSAGFKPDMLLPIIPFAFDKKTKTQPSTFEVTFFMDGIRYQYGFSATSKKITREWLLSWPKGRSQTWFERDIEEIEPYFGPSLRGQNKAIWEKVKDNSLFLSTAAQWNHDQLSKIYMWFGELFRELPNRENGISLTNEMFLDTKNTKEKSELYDLAKNILKNADFGIDDIEVEEVDFSIIELPDETPEDIRKAFFKKTTKYPYKTTFSHCNGKYSLSLEEESDGTKRFYSFLGPLLQSIGLGYTIFEDELELNMHPLLTRKLIELVRKFEGGDNKCAQLIFTTHDTTLLDPELFGRDQVWFTEKDKQGATQLYSLADYKETVRKGEPMQKRYLAGRYGAIPILERF